MQAIDKFLRILAALTAIGLLVLPDRTAMILLCVLSFAIGLWCVMFPPGVIGWVKTVYQDLDPFDKSKWWAARFTGVFLIVCSASIAIISVSR